MAPERGGASDETGRWGEAQAARYLRRHGLKVLGQRVRVGRRDEIDIVARDGKALVFVEVKTRASEHFGRPLAAVDRRKRQVTGRAAVRYLRRLKRPDVPFRFDVVEVIGTPRTPDVRIRHVANAYGLDRRYLPSAG